MASTTPRASSRSLTPANCVFGRGRVDGRPVVVVGDDFTVRGGSADASISAKTVMAEEMAARVPPADHPHHRGLGRRRLGEDDRDQGRVNLPGGIGGTRGFYYMTANLGQVPVVGLGLGSVAGLGAARLAASHYSVMTKTFGDVRRRPAGGGAAGRALDQAGTGRLGDPDAAPAPSTTPSTPRRKPSSARAASCPTCRPRCTACRR